MVFSRGDAYSASPPAPPAPRPATPQDTHRAGGTRNGVASVDMSDDEAGAAAPAVKRTPFAAKRKEGGESEADKHRANKRPKGEGGGGGGGKDGKDGKDDGKDKKPLELTTLFFGQMPYDTKVEDIVPWLKTILKREGCAGDIHAVRLAGGGPTNKKFKGYAFVDFTSRKAAKKCRKFHGTLFRGRKVSIEPCTRQEFSESKAMKAKKAAEAGEPGGAAGGGKKQLKQLVDSDTITAMVKEACDASEGALAESDLDAKLKSFLSLLPKDVAAAALKAIRKQAPKAPQATKAKYFMGIVKKTSKMHWDKSEAKKKREENARGAAGAGGGGGAKGKGAKANGDDADGDAD